MYGQLFKFLVYAPVFLNNISSFSSFLFTLGIWITQFSLKPFSPREVCHLVHTFHQHKYHSGGNRTKEDVPGAQGERFLLMGPLASEHKGPTAWIQCTPAWWPLRGTCDISSVLYDKGSPSPPCWQAELPHRPPACLASLQGALV